MKNLQELSMQRGIFHNPSFSNIIIFRSSIVFKTDRGVLLSPACYSCNAQTIIISGPLHGQEYAEFFPQSFRWGILEIRRAREHFSCL